MSGGQRGLTKRSISGVLWIGLSVGAEGLLQLVAVMVLTRMLAPGEFGLFAAALIVIGFSTIFSGLGVGPAIVQRPALEERHLRVGFTLSIILSLLVAGIVWASAALLSTFFRLEGLAPVVREASLIFVFQGAAMVAQAMAQRGLRFRWLAAVDASAFAVGFVIVGPVLAWLGFGARALIGALLTQHALRMMILLLGQPHPKRPRLDLLTISELVYFGGGFTMARVCNYLANQTDKLVVGRWLGAQALGLYMLAYQIVTAPAIMVGQVLDRVLFPAMALVQLEPARLARAYRTGIAVCCLVSLPIGLVVAVLASEIVTVLLGKQWSGAVAPLQILAFGILFRTSYKLSDSVARATGAVYARAWRQGAYALTIATLSLVGQRWGLQGVAVGVVVALILNFLAMAQLSLRLTGMSWGTFAKAHAPGAALAMTLGTIVWIIAAALRTMSLPPIVVMTCAILAAAAGAALLWRHAPAVFLGPDGQSLLRTLAGMTPPPFRQWALWLLAKEISDEGKDAVWPRAGDTSSGHTAGGAALSAHARSGERPV